MTDEKKFFTYLGIGSLLAYIFSRIGIKTMANFEQRKQFKKTMEPIANAIEREFGIKPVITITQSAHESNWGKSELTKKANNLFGFTKGSWIGDTINMPTREYIAGQWITVARPFRAYESWYDSVKNWAEIISSASRYSEAYKFAKIGDLKSFAVAVAKGGYATDPKYAQKLIGVAKVVKSTPLSEYVNIPEGSKRIKFDKGSES